MPWRDCGDPYRVWLSEVMLQQTQVETVKPYFNEWIKKYPTVQHVAEAEQDSILKSWEGLGYYSRARNFHKACQQVVCDYDGDIPNEAEPFSKLKGVGPYTVAAVQSIAFNRSLPAVDGNLKRVVARIKRISKPPSKALPEIEQFLNQHIHKKRPGDFNQAMMDLGAMICRPGSPICSRCPVASLCEGYQKGDADTFPIKEKKIKRPHYKIAVGIIRKKDKILISKRKVGGMLGGLWEFPGGKKKHKESANSCAVREIKEEVGINVRPRFSVGKIRHAYSHFSIEMEGIVCDFVSGRARTIECDAYRWIRIDDVQKYAFPKANHKLFRLLRDSGKGLLSRF